MEEYLAFKHYKYLRLDGGSTISERRDMVMDWQTKWVPLFSRASLLHADDLFPTGRSSLSSCSRLALVVSESSEHLCPRPESPTDPLSQLDRRRYRHLLRLGLEPFGAFSPSVPAAKADRLKPSERSPSHGSRPSSWTDEAGHRLPPHHEGHGRRANRSARQVRRLSQAFSVRRSPLSHSGTRSSSKTPSSALPPPRRTRVPRPRRTKSSRSSSARTSSRRDSDKPSSSARGPRRRRSRTVEGAPRRARRTRSTRRRRRWRRRPRRRGRRLREFRLGLTTRKVRPLSFPLLVSCGG